MPTSKIIVLLWDRHPGNLQAGVHVNIAYDPGAETEF